MTGPCTVRRQSSWRGSGTSAREPALHALMRFVPRALRSATFVALPLVCTSCFTMGLWGLLPEDEEDPCTGNHDVVFELDADAEWSWDAIGLRLLLTPFALGLDVLTAPVQCVLLADDDDGC